MDTLHLLHLILDLVQVLLHQLFWGIFQLWPGVLHPLG